MEKNALDWVRFEPAIQKSMEIFNTTVYFACV